MVTLLELPQEIRRRILGVLGNQLRFEHEEGIRRQYIQADGFAAGYIRLGFDLPLPIALLLANRQLYHESVDFVFSTCPLRVDVAEHTAFEGTYEHYDNQEGIDASYVSEKWTMLTSRLMPDYRLMDAKLSHVQHIIQHPFIDRLKSLHVNHWVTSCEGQWIVSGPPVDFALFIRALPGLQQLIIQLDISHLDEYAYEPDLRRSHMTPPHGVAYKSLEMTPVIHVASELPSGSSITTTFIVREATEYRSEDPRTKQPLQLLKDHLTRELANGVRLGLFYQHDDVLGHGRYAVDARRSKRHLRCRGLGVLEQPAGCAIEPGHIRQFHSDGTEYVHVGDFSEWSYNSNDEL